MRNKWTSGWDGN
jgi:hypothetical protein